MIKSYSFYSYKLNSEKLEFIKSYIIECVELKNILGSYLYENHLLDMYLKAYSCNKFIPESKNLRPKHIHSQIFQCLQKEVFSMYQNRVDTLEVKLYKNNLTRYVKYLVKSYNRDLNSYKQILMKKYKKENDEFYNKLLQLIDKFGDRLLNFVIKIQNSLFNKVVINFHSLTIPIINNLGKTCASQMYQKAENIKICNGVIVLNLKQKICIPFKYNKSYHGDLDKYTYCENPNTGQKQYSCILKIEGDKLRIIATTNVQETIIKFENINENNTLGLDVNCKNNIFQLSNGKSIQANENIIIKNEKALNKQARVKQTKSKRGIEKQPQGKKLQLITEKNNRRNKAFIEYICNLLCKECIKKGQRNLIIEDLQLFDKVKGLFKELKIKYSHITRCLHINDIKNVLLRIASKFGIKVHFVAAEYTSITCPICGHIHKNNRKDQETFSCVKCGYTNNADLNASYNIKNRIMNDFLRDELEVYDEVLKCYIPKFKSHSYINKTTYRNIYSLVCSNTNGGFI